MYQLWHTKPHTNMTWLWLSISSPTPEGLDDPTPWGRHGLRSWFASSGCIHHSSPLLFTIVHHYCSPLLFTMIYIYMYTDTIIYTPLYIHHYVYIYKSIILYCLGSPRLSTIPERSAFSNARTRRKNAEANWAFKAHRTRTEPRNTPGEC